jgi:hypothetical protein
VVTVSSPHPGCNVTPCWQGGKRAVASPESRPSGSFVSQTPLLSRDLLEQWGERRVLGHEHIRLQRHQRLEVAALVAVGAMDRRSDT